MGKSDRQLYSVYKKLPLSIQIQLGWKCMDERRSSMQTVIIRMK